MMSIMCKKIGEIISSIFVCALVIGFYIGVTILGLYEIKISKNFVFACDYYCSNGCAGLNEEMYVVGMTTLWTNVISIIGTTLAQIIWYVPVRNKWMELKMVLFYCIGCGPIYGYFAHVFFIVMAFPILYHFSPVGYCYQCKYCYPSAYFIILNSYTVYILLSILGLLVIVCIIKAIKHILNRRVQNNQPLLENIELIGGENLFTKESI